MTRTKYTAVRSHGNTTEQANNPPTGEDAAPNNDEDDGTYYSVGGPLIETITEGSFAVVLAKEEDDWTFCVSLGKQNSAALHLVQVVSVKPRINRVQWQWWKAHPRAIAARHSRRISKAGAQSPGFAVGSQQFRAESTYELAEVPPEQRAAHVTIGDEDVVLWWRPADRSDWGQIPFVLFDQLVAVLAGPPAMPGGAGPSAQPGPTSSSAEAGSSSQASGRAKGKQPAVGSPRGRAPTNTAAGTGAGPSSSGAGPSSQASGQAGDKRPAGGAPRGRGRPPKQPRAAPGPETATEGAGDGGGRAAKIVGVFTYKGGVGKTTTTINLGAALAGEPYNKKVLYVDCDSQCNLSTFFNPTKMDQADDQAEEEAVDDRAAPQAGGGHLPELSMFACMDPVEPGFDKQLARQGAYNTAGQRIDFTLTRAIRAVNEARSETLHDIEVVKFCEADGYENVPKNLYLLPGGLDILSYLETRLQDAKRSILSSRTANGQYYSTMGAFRSVLEFFAHKLSLDFIVCDFGPSSGIVNQVFLSSCDYILPTCNPDFFSASAVSGLLHTVLPEMVYNHEAMTTAFNQYDDPDKDSLLQRRINFDRPFPKILPFLFTNFFITKRKMVRQEDSNLFKVITDIVMDPDVKPQIKALYQADRKGNMVVSFLKTCPAAFKCAHECAHPASLLLCTNPSTGKSVVDENYIDKGYALPYGARHQLIHVMQAFGRLAEFMINI